MNEHTHNELFIKVGEVYAAVIWLSRFVCALCLLVVLKVIANSLIYSRMVRISTRIESLLTLAEKHGALTDDKANELKTSQQQAVKNVAAVVKQQAASIKNEVPGRVVEEIERAKVSRESGDGTLPVIP